MKLSPTKFFSSVLLSFGLLCTQAIGAPAQLPNPVIEWNKTLLSIVRTPNMQPATMHSTRSFAMMHLAIDEAVNHFPGKGNDSALLQNVAAAAAAQRVLLVLYPAAESTLTQAYQSSLAELSQSPSFNRFVEAVAAGRLSAEHILKARANDGAAKPADPYTFGTNPGDYQSTPPNFPKQPQLLNWDHVQPFSLEQAWQFRPGPPPALNSGVYSKNLNEVQFLGSVVNSTATTDQMAIGKFWNGSIQNYWNEIAQTVSTARRLSTIDTSRVFTLLNVTLADSVIAFYDAKYRYNFWRPVTAIREANPEVTPGAVNDPQWLPETTNTAPDPSYPGAHAVISAAAAEVLISALQTDWLSFDVTSEVVGGVKRHFDSLSEAEQEATRSRVYAGAHFTFDLVTGERLGRRVAGFVIDHSSELHK
jgi:hypothetical protein